VKWKRLFLSICITGESAEDIQAIGKDDIKSYFLPKGKLKIPEKDIVSVSIYKE
jgi:hypothetical protein